MNATVAYLAPFPATWDRTHGTLCGALVVAGFDGYAVKVMSGRLFYAGTLEAGIEARNELWRAGTDAEVVRVYPSEPARDADRRAPYANVWD